MPILKCQVDQCHGALSDYVLRAGTLVNLIGFALCFDLFLGADFHELMRDFFDFGGPEPSTEKEKLLSQLQAVARDLDEVMLAIAVDQIKVLHDRQ